MPSQITWNRVASCWRSRLLAGLHRLRDRAGLPLRTSAVVVVTTSSSSNSPSSVVLWRCCPQLCTPKPCGLRLSRTVASAAAREQAGLWQDDSVTAIARVPITRTAERTHQRTQIQSTDVCTALLTIQDMVCVKESTVRLSMHRELRGEDTITMFDVPDFPACYNLAWTSPISKFHPLSQVSSCLPVIGMTTGSIFEAWLFSNAMLSSLPPPAALRKS